MPRGGWLIFNLPPAELGGASLGRRRWQRHHQLFFMCDDITRRWRTLAAQGRGVSTSGRGGPALGLITSLRVPGAGGSACTSPTTRRPSPVRTPGRARRRVRRKARRPSSPPAPRPTGRSSRRRCSRESGSSRHERVRPDARRRRRPGRRRVGHRKQSMYLASAIPALARRPGNPSGPSSAVSRLLASSWRITSSVKTPSRSSCDGSRTTPSSEELVGDDERPDGVVARPAAGVADDVGIPSLKPAYLAGSRRASMQVRMAKPAPAAGRGRLSNRTRRRTPRSPGGLRQEPTSGSRFRLGVVEDVARVAHAPWPTYSTDLVMFAEVRRPVKLGAGRGRGPRRQQMRGSGSPTSMSTILVPPNVVTSTTMPGGSGGSHRSGRHPRRVGGLATP